MSSFTEPLIVQKVVEPQKKKLLGFIKYDGHKNYWVTARAFRYYVKEEGSEDFIDVPAGTKTDFASVPWFVRWLIDRDGEYTQAAVLHDHLYTTHQRNRDESDHIFLEAMDVLGTPKWKQDLMFTAVQKFGDAAYWKRGK